MRYDRECLYNVRWQRLRMALLGNWDTTRNVVGNLNILNDYYAETVCFDRTERAIRISNYLSAILLGYGSKEMFVEQAQKVRAAQRHFSSLTGGKYATAAWDWNVVEQDLKTADEAFLKSLLVNLKGRIKTSTKRTGGTQFRPELMKFVGLLKAEMSSRGLTT